MARIGWILGGLAAMSGLGLALSHRASASPRAPRVPPSPAPSPLPAPSVSSPFYPSGVPTMDQSYTADTWRPIIHQMITTEFPRIAEPYAMKWGELESGWNPCAVGNPGELAADGSNAQPRELGLGQAYNPDDVRRYGIDPARLRAYAPEAAPLAVAYRQAKLDQAAAQKAGNLVAYNDAVSRAHVAAARMQSRTRPLTDAEMHDQVKYTLLLKIADGMTSADHAVAYYGLHWSVPDYWKLVKAPHALPVILGNGMPAVVKKLGHAPASWAEFRKVLGMESNDQWRRALNACEACASAIAPMVA